MKSKFMRSWMPRDLSMSTTLAAHIKRKGVKMAATGIKRQNVSFTAKKTS